LHQRDVDPSEEGATLGEEEMGGRLGLRWLQELEEGGDGRGGGQGLQGGGGCTRENKGGLARVVGKNSGLPTARSRSTVQTQPHACAPVPRVQNKHKFYCFTDVYLLKFQTPIAWDPKEKNKEKKNSNFSFF
jgi:hypothetical protein